MVSGVALYAVHRIGHIPTFGYTVVLLTRLWWKWYLIHSIGHHRVAYPETEFLASEYTVNKSDVFGIGTLVYFVPEAAILFTFTILTCDSASQILFLWSMLIVLLVFEDWMHAEIHLDGSYFERFHWFLDLRAAHKLHHKSQSKVNYGVVNLTFDYLFGTFQNPI
jgi:sterol desaturase/sphingolipid hydroxylase (fatty acid hydroxylase superfamily)